MCDDKDPKGKKRKIINDKKTEKDKSKIEELEEKISSESGDDN